MLVKNNNIIVVGLQPWDSEIGSNCINIAREFARHNRVLYVNFPLDRISLKREQTNPLFQHRISAIKQGKQALEKVENNIWNLSPACILESANWIPFTPLFRLLNRKNNQRFAREIKKAATSMGFHNYVLFNDSDMFRSYHLKTLLKPLASIYYTRDNLMGVPYWFKHGRYLEPEVFADADAVTANSTYLAKLAEKHNPRSFYVGQGCDVQDFDLEKVATVPADIASVNSPVIGYIGVLYALRLDLQLLETLAEQRPSWNIVLIGPEDQTFQKSRLHGMHNVHFLGRKDAAELPNYLARFDVAINPQIMNEVTIGNYPRKIDEYLAMGKPTVATRTEAMSIFADHVYLANSSTDYLQLIERALAENSPEKEKQRIAFARTHTWENSVAEIYKALITVKPELAAS
ncbi:MAG: glycosyltransferase [Chitinophagaceae bacterium]